MARKSYKIPDFDRLKSKLVKFRANVGAIIYNGLVHQARRAIIVSQLRNEATYTASSCGLNVESAKYLFNLAYALYVKVLKNTSIGLSKARKDAKGVSYHKNLKQRSNVVYSSLDKLLFTDNYLVKGTNELIRVTEKNARMKQMDMLFNEELKSGYTPFMLCSSHVNPAKDHEDYQGRMYFDKNYKEHTYPKGELEKINAYISNHNLISVQEIMGAPVYLCTRRNCKHYFVPIPIEKVLHTSKNVLLKNYHMIVEGKEAKTYADRALNMYKARYKSRAEMWKVMPNDELAKDISNDKQLIRKWAKMASL